MIWHFACHFFLRGLDHSVDFFTRLGNVGGMLYSVLHVQADDCCSLFLRTNALIHSLFWMTVLTSAKLINAVHTGLFFHLKSSKYNVQGSMKAQWCLLTSQWYTWEMKWSALPATRSYWIRMLAISQMLCMQVKLESPELEHNSLKQRAWLWSTVSTWDIMVSFFGISFFFSFW